MSLDLAGRGTVSILSTPTRTADELPPSQRPASGRLVCVDVLRGAAALAVVLCHSSFRPDDTSWWFRLVVCQPFRFGFLGVSLFVVLSGFCIHLAVAKNM